MRLLDKLLSSFAKRRKARHERWKYRNRVLRDPCAAATDPRCRLEAGKVRL